VLKQRAIAAIQHQIMQDTAALYQPLKNVPEL
jgi:hypothetical protein